MKCRRCKAEAVVSLPSHNTAFCADCFLEFFSRQVDRGIHEQKLMTREDHVLVALSGGKDSLALMLELGRQGYNVTGLHIDLGIPQSSPAARSVVERFCAKYGFPLIVRDMKNEGLAIPKVKSMLHRPVCSACGKIKRYFFNQTARKGGFNVLATGHNLDDETARLTSNTLRWDIAYLSDQGPRLDDADGFTRKVKPFWRVTEFETANYAFLMGIENHYAPCPYSQGASFSTLKSLWIDLEEQMPGRKMNFYQGFLERGRKVFQGVEEKQGEALAPCERCGYPTSAGMCGVCRIREALAEKEGCPETDS
ncbi:TIGR00269 family protein [uncultured Mailhella sp.]|uniref:TIGR00269 family protein n=1 Tax=uncultured Mailhella sp. TaxID=1981031 RepID=UPI00260FA3AE|nr:TIGR00269 family protein [uncultured Mailhella sp.]